VQHQQPRHHTKLTIGVDCGATIEIWPSDIDATARKDYIQTTLKANQALGTEVRHAAWIGAWIGAAASDWSGQALAREGVCHCVHLVAYQPGPEVQPGLHQDER
jgi:hypothetical protein